MKEEIEDKKINILKTLHPDFDDFSKKNIWKLVKFPADQTIIILDMGIGYGRFSVPAFKALSEKYPDAKIKWYGIDSEDKFIKHIESEAKECNSEKHKIISRKFDLKELAELVFSETPEELKRVFREKCPELPDSYDVLFAPMSPHWLADSDWRSIMIVLLRLLKKNGIFCFAEIAGDWLLLKEKGIGTCQNTDVAKWWHDRWKDDGSYREYRELTAEKMFLLKQLIEDECFGFQPIGIPTYSRQLEVSAEAFESWIQIELFPSLAPLRNINETESPKKSDRKPKWNFNGKYNFKIYKKEIDFHENTKIFDFVRKTQLPYNIEHFTILWEEDKVEQYLQNIYTILYNTYTLPPNFTAGNITWYEPTEKRYAKPFVFGNPRKVPEGHSFCEKYKKWIEGFTRFDFSLTSFLFDHLQRFLDDTLVGQISFTSHCENPNIEINREEFEGLYLLKFKVKMPQECSKLGENDIEWIFDKSLNGTFLKEEIEKEKVNIWDFLKEHCELEYGLSVVFPLNTWIKKDGKWLSKNVVSLWIVYENERTDETIHGFSFKEEYSNVLFALESIAGKMLTPFHAEEAAKEAKASEFKEIYEESIHMQRNLFASFNALLINAGDTMQEGAFRGDNSMVSKGLRRLTLATYVGKQIAQRNEDILAVLKQSALEDFLLKEDKLSNFRELFDSSIKNALGAYAGGKYDLRTARKELVKKLASVRRQDPESVEIYLKDEIAELVTRSQFFGQEGDILHAFKHKFGDTLTITFQSSQPPHSMRLSKLLCSILTIIVEEFLINALKYTDVSQAGGIITLELNGNIIEISNTPIKKQALQARFFDPKEAQSLPLGIKLAKRLAAKASITLFFPEKEETIKKAIDDNRWDVRIEIEDKYIQRGSKHDK